MEWWWWRGKDDEDVVLRKEWMNGFRGGKKWEREREESEGVTLVI